MSDQPSIHGIVVAGGKSRRMGSDKALLPIHGKPLLRHICDQLTEVCEQITIVVACSGENAYRDVVDGTVHIVADFFTDHGPLAGIHAGLSTIPDGYGFILACDMPEFSLPLFRTMSEQLGTADAVLCREQPFHGFYHKRVADKAELRLRGGQLRMSEFLSDLNVIYIDVKDDACFTNLNSPDEYQRFLQKD